MLAYVYIPIVQREIDTFMELWNSSRCRLQKDTLMPDGIPDFIYSNPEAYDLEDKGWELSSDELENVARVSGVLNVEMITSQWTSGGNAVRFYPTQRTYCQKMRLCHTGHCEENF
jgi:hypothetical protein